MGLDKRMRWPLLSDLCKKMNRRLPGIIGQEREHGKGGQRHLSLFCLNKSASTFSIRGDLWTMLPKWLVYCSGANGKRWKDKSKSVRRSDSLANNLSSNRLILAGWSVTKISEAVSMLSGKVDRDTLIISAQVEHVPPACHHRLHLS